MWYWKKENENNIEISEYEFYRNAIKDFDKAEYISNVSQVCIIYYKNNIEIARQVSDVGELKNYIPKH